MTKTKVKPFKKEQSISMGNLYDLNKQIMEQTAKPLTHLELAAKQEALDDWFNWKIDCYAMLLCHERRDYTIFHLYENQNPNPTAIAAKECIECLKERGEILSIEKTSDNIAWEIWIKIKNGYFCYYLFPYDDGVIEC